METPHGGRITLRRSPEGDPTPGFVEYAGEASTPTEKWPVRVRVAMPDGAIAWLSDNEASVPEWLSGFLRATLRAAWRASRAGAPWPRRLNRWRDGGADEPS